MRRRDALFHESAKRAGGIVEPVQGLGVESIRARMPKVLQRHSELPRFAAAVADYAAQARCMALAAPDQTADQVRGAIEAVESEAHRLANALTTHLARGTDAFDAVAVDWDYVAARARERDMPTEGRPVVPRLPPDAPADLSGLLRRVHDDLQMLRAITGHTAAKITPQRGTRHHHERMLIEWIAQAWVDCFGQLPPKRGSFANKLLRFVGDRAGMTLGADLCESVVQSLAVERVG